nr:MAG TPA: tail component [Caudoviricetes sp.]
MSITYHERPGVYSDYEASSITATAAGSKVVAACGVSTAAAGLYTVTSYTSAATTFGEDSELGRMLRLLYLNGAGTVLVSPVASDTLEDYKAALQKIMEEGRAAYVVIGSADEQVQKELLSQVQAASEARHECLGLVGLAKPTLEHLTDRAEQLNSERMVLVGPGVYLSGVEDEQPGCMAAAALAGVLAAQTDPAVPLNGAQLRGLTGVSATYNDTEMDTLIRGGITAVEPSGGSITVVRGITTRTTTGEAPDTTFRELNTILIIDEVIPAVRNALRARFSRAKNNAVTRSAIRSQVTVELQSRVEREIIDSFEAITVTADETDPTVCLVEFGFTVTHGLSRIYLTAHISV